MTLTQFLDNNESSSTWVLIRITTCSLTHFNGVQKKKKKTHKHTRHTQTHVRNLCKIIKDDVITYTHTHTHTLKHTVHVQKTHEKRQEEIKMKTL